MSLQIPVFEPEEALALLSASGFSPELSAVADQNCLLLAGSAKLDESAAADLAKCLHRLACPSIAIADTGLNQPWVTAADVVVANEVEAELLAAEIAKSPVAATTFVQLLRITEGMPLEDALDVESLAYSTLQGGAEYQSWLAANRADAGFVPTETAAPILAERDGDTLQLSLNRASNDNAMSVEMRDALIEALDIVLADEGIRAVKLQGNGRCFSTGGDLTEFGQAPDPATAHIVRTLSVPGRLLSRCSSRVAVHMHGINAGSGVEFPAFAASVTADADTRFVLPEVGMGLIPGAGGCISIPRRIGRQKTAWLGLSGERIDAKQALTWGLIDKIIE